ncbi:distal membrane-arm assembly complex protein 2 isoform X4 [Hirundo rustica]|uniref:distal membrane-arm assembly complex protein 2 isoform X4 n=1 Tax=Hirundo rustica TaxID=43150 RepID=UPI002673A113|nr:distal membrane-arm assembly complex protein 2 isoform X4 [Hirundo rustica]
MAALRAVRGSRGAPALRPPPGQRRGSSGGLRAHLGRWGQHLEAAAGWAERWRLRNLNAPRPTLRLTPDIAAAEFTLSCGGGVRFLGQPRWLRPGALRELPRLRHLPVVGVDLSGTPVTYGGLDNLVSLAHLAHLDLSGCPHLSDWALGRLHVFSGTLQHLALARCPQLPALPGSLRNSRSQPRAVPGSAGGGAAGMSHPGPGGAPGMSH